MYVLRLVVLTACVLSGHVTGYRSGAPVTRCGDMTPMHGGQRPMSSPPPYTVSVSQTSYKPGDVITVTLQGGNGNMFRGFIMEAFLQGTNTAVGSFVAPMGAKTMACGPGGQEGVTHTDGSDKSVLKFQWTPPPTNVGDIIFVASVVRRYDYFWVGVFSPDIAPAAGPPAVSEVPASALSTQKTQTTRKTTPTPILITNTTSTITTESLIPGILRRDPECRNTKGCFSKCSGETCDFIVTWRHMGDYVSFELSAQMSGHMDRWIAVGFSEDKHMGHDSVTECVSNGGVIQVFQSHNDGKQNIRLDNPKAGLVEGPYSYANGVFKCSFQRAIQVPGEARIFNLNQDWQIMFASGEAGSGFSKMPHVATPISSAQKVNLMSTGTHAGGATRYPLVKVHAIFMILAWVFFTGIGITVARYYKPVWEDRTVLGLKVWFQIHRACMIAVVILTVIAFIIIFVEAQGYSQINVVKGREYLVAHPILGIIVTVLAMTNPIMSIFRCAPDAPRRKIFNWAHWAVGIMAHVLAVITICFGVQMSKSTTPDFAVYIVIAYIIYHVCMSIALEVVEMFIKRQEDAKVDSIEMKENNANGQTGQTTEKKKNLKDSLTKKILLLVHFIMALIFTIVLILLVAVN